MSLNSSSFAERAAAAAEAIAEGEAICTAEIRKMNSGIRAAHDFAAQRRESVAREAAARFDELDAALAVDTLAALEPLARAFPTASRATASTIAQTWRELQQRAREELGTEIHCSHLAIAFANAAGFAASFGERDAFDFDGSHPAANAADKASRAILGGAHDAVVDGVIRELEIAVVSQAQTRAYVADAERAKAKASRCTFAGMKEQAERIDRERAAAVVPAPVPDHVHVIGG